MVPGFFKVSEVLFIVVASSSGWGSLATLFCSLAFALPRAVSLTGSVILSFLQVVFGRKK